MENSGSIILSKLFEKHEIRGKAPWFCFRDICDAIGIEMTDELLASLAPGSITRQYIHSETENVSIRTDMLYRFIFTNDEDAVRLFRQEMCSLFHNSDLNFMLHFSSKHPMMRFLRAHCILQEDAEIDQIKLYNKYNEWTEKNKGIVLSRSKFLKELNLLGFEVTFPFQELKGIALKRYVQ